MAVELTLGGVRRRWHLHGDDALHAWAQSRPWLGGGSTLSVVVPADAAAVRGWLRRSIWAWDLGASDVRVVELDVCDRAALLREVGGWLGVAATDLHPLAKALGEDLSGRPAVFLMTVPDAVTASAVFELAEELRDWISKLDHPRAPTVVILHRGPVGIVRGSLRGDFGWPVGIVEGIFAAATREARWSLYLHLRIACEVGGRIDEAIACDRLGFADLACGDDDGCERVLNRHATECFAALPAEEAHAWRARSRAGSWSKASSSRIDGVSWTSELRATPSPWLARALLQEPGAVASRRRLRSEIICHPLAEALLNICFALEATQRASLGELATDPPDDHAVAQFERFQSARPSATRDLYPAGHPAPPRDAWDFASLGSVQRALDGSADLLQLRNALAHGHYAGWTALCRVHELLSRSER